MKQTQFEIGMTEAEVTDKSKNLARMIDDSHRSEIKTYEDKIADTTKEIDALKALGVDVTTKLVISKRAHLILPTHRLIDAASEASKGKNKIGSTLKGIGPTYMDKTGRNGLRIGDIETNEFKEKYFISRKFKAKLLLFCSIQRNNISFSFFYNTTT